MPGKFKELARGSLRETLRRRQQASNEAAHKVPKNKQDGKKADIRSLREIEAHREILVFSNSQAPL
jgi:hypothetical protein